MRKKHDFMTLYHEVQRLKEENKDMKEKLRSLGVDLNRCPVMLPNAHGHEQCGRRRGHDGKCCYQRGD